MALKLEERFEIVTGGIIKSVTEGSSLLGNLPETKYVFRNYEGKRRVLKLKTHLGYDGNSAQRGDLMIVSQSPEGSFQIEVSEMKNGKASKKRYTYFSPSSETELL